MLKKITFCLLVLFCISGFTNISFAQSSSTEPVSSLKKGSKKTLRKYKRAQRNTLNAITIGHIVTSKNFDYYPNQLDYTSSMHYQNIQLSNYYLVSVTPTQLRVLLPIYGAGRYSEQPSIWKELDFFTGNFKYNAVQNPKSKNWIVTIKAMDTWSFNTFTFVFTISSSSYAQMSIDTPFVGPAYFSGNLVSN